MRWQHELPLTVWPQLAAVANDAASRAPDNPAIWTGLAQAAFNLGREEETVAPLQAAVQRMPDAVPLRVALARTLTALDRFEEALDHVQAVLDRDPDNRDARAIGFTLLAKTDQWGKAVREVDRVCELDPFALQLLDVAWRAWPGQAGLERLLARSEAILAERPDHTNAAYFRAFALAKLGRGADACRVMSVERFVEVGDLPAPAGHAGGDAFRAALREEIVHNPTLVLNPRGKSTRDGRRTRRLRRAEAPAVEALVAQIKDAVGAYTQRLSVQPGDFAQTLPQTARLDIWASVLGPEGRQKSHRHISGWLSGVYYVCAPRPAGENAYRGPLHLGALDPKRDRIDPPWGVRDIEPVPGRLVLFPSYVPHATEPTGAQGDRISVAFDVIAVR